MVAVKEISWEEASDPAFGQDTRQAFRAAVQTVADKAKAALPDANGRIEKAVAIVLSGDIQFLDDGRAKVSSQSSGTTEYAVCNGVCECPDYPRAPQGLCKHRLSVAISKRATQLVKGQLTPQETAQEPAPAQPAHGIAPEHITFLHGKAFVRYAGLLAMAHQRGLISIKAEFVSVTADMAIAKAEVTFADGRVFTEAADATPENVTRQVRPHFARMALVRAKARALRDALSIGITALEEMADNE